MDSRKQGKSLNVVHNDEIWKDHIHRELYAQKRWPDRWGYLSQMYSELGDWGKGPSAKQEPGTNHGPPVVSSQSNETFPKTTAQVIGWKSAVKRRNAYEVSEGRARGKCDIVRVFRWPREGQC